MRRKRSALYFLGSLYAEKVKTSAENISCCGGKGKTELFGFTARAENTAVVIELVKERAMDGEQYPFEGVYSINLCPDTERMGKLADIVGYSVTHVTEDGDETYVNSAKDMNICLFNLNGKEEEFRYEALLYVVHLIEQVKDK